MARLADQRNSTRRARPGRAGSAAAVVGGPRPRRGPGHSHGTGAIHREGVTGRRVAHRSLRAAVAVLLRRSARRRGPPVPASDRSLRGQSDQRQHNAPSQRHSISQRPLRGYGINPHGRLFTDTAMGFCRRGARREGHRRQQAPVPHHTQTPGHRRRHRRHDVEDLRSPAGEPRRSGPPQRAGTRAGQAPHRPDMEAARKVPLRRACAPHTGSGRAARPDPGDSRCGAGAPGAGRGDHRGPTGRRPAVVRL